MFERSEGIAAYLEIFHSSWTIAELDDRTDTLGAHHECVPPQVALERLKLGLRRNW